MRYQYKNKIMIRNMKIHGQQINQIADSVLCLKEKVYQFKVFFLFLKKIKSITTKKKKNLTLQSKHA